MEFDREVFDLMPSGNKTFNLIGLKMPSDKDIFFRAKQKETLDKYQAARRFMYGAEMVPDTSAIPYMNQHKRVQLGRQNEKDILHDTARMSLYLCFMI